MLPRADTVSVRFSRPCDVAQQIAGWRRSGKFTSPAELTAAFGFLRFRQRIEFDRVRVVVKLGSYDIKHRRDTSCRFRQSEVRLTPLREPPLHGNSPHVLLGREIRGTPFNPLPQGETNSAYK